MRIPLIAEVMKKPSILGGIDNPSFDICMAALVLDGMCIKYINSSLFTRREYHSMCEAAVRQNPKAFTKIKRERFSALKWKNLKLFAARQNGLVLRWINEQTPEICLEAIKNNPKAFSFVDKSLCGSRCYNLLKKAAEQKIKENEIDAKDKGRLKNSRKIRQKQTNNLLNAKKQTEALCLKAVMQDGLQIRYVWKQTRKLCLAAFNQNPRATDFIRDSSIITFDDLFYDACKHLGSMADGIGDLMFYYTDKKAKKIPSKLKTEGKQINTEQYYKSCAEALDKNYCNIKFVNPYFLTLKHYKNLCLKAIIETSKALIYIAKAKMTKEWYYRIIREIFNKANIFEIENCFKYIDIKQLTNKQYYNLLKSVLKLNTKEKSFNIELIDAKKLTNDQYFSICRTYIYNKSGIINDIQPELLTDNQYTVCG